MHNVFLFSLLSTSDRFDVPDQIIFRVYSPAASDAAAAPVSIRVFEVEFQVDPLSVWSVLPWDSGRPYGI